MSKQRLVDTCFWDDNYVQKLDPSEKLLFLYLLTNPLTNICGVYEISMQRIAFDTGFDRDTVQRMLRRFQRDGRCLYKGGWLAMRNWLKHQVQGSPKVQKGIAVQLRGVPTELVKYIGYPQVCPQDEPGKSMDTLSHPNPNPNTKFNPNPNDPHGHSGRPGRAPDGAPERQPIDRQERIKKKRDLLAAQAKMLGVKEDSDDTSEH